MAPPILPDSASSSSDSSTRRIRNIILYIGSSCSVESTAVGSAIAAFAEGTLALSEGSVILVSSFILAFDLDVRAF
jgi:Zn finger protein HypA/HybF involved in hydrogenase expression